MTSERLMTPEEEEAARAEVRAVMAADKLTMRQVGDAIGLAYGTFSSWMGGTYNGRTDRVAADARRGLEAIRAKARTRALAPRAPAFVATPTAELLSGLLMHAQHMGEFGVAVGGPGIGKTTTAREYRARNPNAWLLTAEPVHSTPRALLDDLAEALGVEARGLSSQKLSRAVTTRLRGSGGLLMIDDAQHLTSQVLDQLRAIHDQAEIGIALLGNETLFARLEGGSRAAHYAQLFSRVGLRLTRPRPTRADIEALIAAWNITGAAERALLGWIAKKPGALRSMTKVLRIAHMLAAAENAAVDERLIRLAWTQHSGDAGVGEDAAILREAA